MSEEFHGYATFQRGLHFNTEMFKPPETGKKVSVVLSKKRPVRGRRIRFGRDKDGKTYWLIKITSP